jgi:hypothetical protein
MIFREMAATGSQARSEPVTSLFTDLFRSTAILDRLGDAYADLLGDHHRLMRETITATGPVLLQQRGLLRRSGQLLSKRLLHLRAHGRRRLPLTAKRGDGPMTPVRPTLMRRREDH